MRYGYARCFKKLMVREFSRTPLNWRWFVHAIQAGSRPATSLNSFRRRNAAEMGRVGSFGVLLGPGQTHHTALLRPFSIR